MGFIKEPKGIDFIVKSNPLTEQDKLQISKVIAAYKLTGRKPTKTKNLLTNRKKSKNLPTTAVAVAQPPRCKKADFSV